MRASRASLPQHKRAPRGSQSTPMRSAIAGQRGFAAMGFWIFRSGSYKSGRQDFITPLASRLRENQSLRPGIARVGWLNHLQKLPAIFAQRGHDDLRGGNFLDGSRRRQTRRMAGVQTQKGNHEPDGAHRGQMPAKREKKFAQVVAAVCDRRWICDAMVTDCRHSRFPNRVELGRGGLMPFKQNFTRRFHISFSTQRRKAYRETQRIYYLCVTPRSPRFCVVCLHFPKSISEVRVWRRTIAILPCPAACP